MPHQSRHVLALLCAFIAVSCGTEKDSDTGFEEDDAVPLNGAEVYADNCSACHGTNGEGAGSNPSLIEAVPNLSDEELMNVLTNPPGIMAIVDLTTPEADAVFSYSRAQFGEYGGAR